MVKDLSVDLCGIRLQNPVVPASGTFGFGLELAGDMDLNVLGGISLKGTTREARYGNPTPRIAECEGGMINSVGLQNPGIDVLVVEKVPALRKVYHGCVIANISGFSLDEYVECCAKADEIILAEEFRAVCDEVLVSTVDGSVGVKGFVTDAIAAGKPAFDYFYTCGPMVMMKVVCNTLEGPGEASLEERMGCGAGFCYGCSIQTKNGPRRVCKDGPVFKKEELIW